MQKSLMRPERFVGINLSLMYHYSFIVIIIGDRKLHENGIRTSSSAITVPTIVLFEI